MILLLGLAIAPVAAHASPLTYNVVLNNVFGNTGNGTGSFTITNPPTSLTNSYSTANGGLTNMNFNIGGDVFNLGNAIGNYGEVDFLLGNLVSVFYVGGDVNKSVDFNLESGLLLYTFKDLYNGERSSGYITAAVASSAPAVPEPTTLLLFGTGMLGLGVLASRKLA
ncbi:MAG TPA: PEP-CTERM sorting domain-containing protein [Edaphobacter sp.]